MSLVSNTSDKGYLVALTTTLVMLFGCAYFCLTANSVSSFEHDVTLLLSGGWRVLNGQVPHNDFYCPLGAGVPFLVALGLHFGNAANAIAIASQIVSFTLAIALFYVGKHRFSAFNLVVLQLWMLLGVAAPRPLGYSVFSISPAMQYNRWGEALVCLLCMILFFERREFNEPNTQTKLRDARTIIESTLIGAILCVCAFIKVIYFAIAACAVAFYCISRQANKFNSLAIAGGIAFVLLVFFLVLNVNPAIMSIDYATVSGAQNVASRVTELASKIVGLYSAELLGKCEGIWLHLAFVFIPIVLLWSICKDRAHTFKTAATALFLVGSGWAVYGLNYQIGDPQIAALAPLYAINATGALKGLTQSWGTSATSTRCLHWGLIIMAFAFPIITSAKDIASICIASKAAQAQAQATTNPQTVTISPTSNKSNSQDNLFGIRWTGKLGADYVKYVYSGVDLIRAQKLEKEQIEAFDFSNPFPLLLSAKPSAGGAFWWHNDYTFNKRSHPSAERALGNAKVLMVPQINRNQHFNALASQQLMELYGDSVSKDFDLVAENETWQLYLKKKR